MRHVPAVLLAAAALALLLSDARGAGAPVPPPSPPSKAAAAPPEAESEKAERPEMPASVQWEAKILTPTILPCEPVILDVTWRNTAAQPVAYPDNQPLLFVVRRTGEKSLRLYWIVRPVRRGLMIPLEPGRAYTRKVPFVLGWEPGETKPPKQFVLTEPGRYEISIVGASNATPMAATVADLTSAADLAARKRWTVEVVRWLVGGRPDPVTVEPALQAIYTQYPTSGYAPWAMWIHATIRTVRRNADDFAEAARLGEALVARYPGFPLREEVFKALVGVYAATGNADQAHLTFAEMERRFPQSRYLASLRARFGKAALRPGAEPEMPPPGTPIPRAAVETSGTDIIPPGVRDTFVAFWQAVARGHFAALDGLLARDFMSDYGAKPYYAPALWKQRKNARSGSIRVRVTTAEMAETYARPRSMPSGAARTWRGALCVIEGSLTVAWDRPDGRRDVSRRPNACWVLCKYPDGRWKLVSEIATTPNLLAAGKAQSIFSKLPRALRTWRISDGQRERCPYEEIKVQLGLAGKVDDGRARWVNSRLFMAGPSRTDPRLEGQIRLPLKSGAAGAGRWVVRDVHICLAMTPGGDLVLRRIDLKMPTEWTRPAPSQLR